MLLPRLALVLALVVPAAACQSSSAVPAQQWAGDLCSGISDWRAHLGDVPDAASTPDLAQYKSAMVSFLDALVRNTGTLIGRIEKAGVPDIPSGDQAARDFKAAFGGLEASFRNAKSTIDHTATDDKGAFAAGLTQVGVVLKGSLDTAGKAFGEISAKYPEIGKAAREAPACNEPSE
jgi:hypothetical protein